MLNLAFFNTYEGKVFEYREWMKTAFSKFDLFALSEVHSHPQAIPNDRIPFPNQYECIQNCYQETHREHFATPLPVVAKVSTMVWRCFIGMTLVCTMCNQK